MVSEMGACLRAKWAKYGAIPDLEGSLLVPTRVGDD